MFNILCLADNVYLLNFVKMILWKYSFRLLAVICWCIIHVERLSTQYTIVTI